MPLSFNKLLWSQETLVQGSVPKFFLDWLFERFRSSVKEGESEKMRDIMDRIRAMGDRLKKEYHAERVILFASYATGEATEDSDVDLLVIVPTSEPFLQRRATVKRLIGDLRNGIPVAPVVLTPQESEDRVRMRDQFIINILEEGVEL